MKCMSVVDAGSRRRGVGGAERGDDIGAAEGAGDSGEGADSASLVSSSTRA